MYGKMSAICCISHFVTHLGPAHFDAPAWWLAIATIVAAFHVLHRATMASFMSLVVLQVLHTIADAPFNPDHWLLIFFVNVSILFSVFTSWLRFGRIDETFLYRQLASAGRLLFLVCYGFAALSKYNTHFLGPASSCGTELAKIQMQVSPWLQYVAWPSIAGWVTVVCESAVVLLLLAPRMRKYGILLGLLFHTALVISPGIAVFDFSVTVFTMLFLFAPADFADRFRERMAEFTSERPLGSVLHHVKLPLLITGCGFMVGRSALNGAMYGDPSIGTVTWLINMIIAATLIYFSGLVLFGQNAIPVGPPPRQRLTFAHYAILGVALFNGACPYLGLKTQGSFTMFSNLRTEGGEWNHLLVPERMRVFSRYQDDLWQVARIDDRRIQRDFVERECLVPGFELRRAARKNPDLSMVVVREGHEIHLAPARLDPNLAELPSWLAMKLLIFRPVTPDGSPYCGN